MSWLDGLATISGTRWSAGAVWGSGTWVDEATWDDTYDPDAEISVGVYLHGTDVTEEVMAASWGLGQTDLLPTALNPSSCNLTLRSQSGGFSHLGFDPAGFEPVVTTDVAVGHRVVILTEWDVLWVGRVESITETYMVDESARTGGPRYQLSLSAADDLARASQAERDASEVLSFDVPQAMRELLAEAGIPAEVLGERGYDGDAAYHVAGSHDGTALDVLAELTYQSVSMAAYTPAGYLVAPMALDWSDDLPSPVDDYDDLYARAIEYAQADTTTGLTVTDGATTYTYTYPDEADVYGLRQLDVDSSAWWTIKPTGEPATTWAGAIVDRKTPVTRLSASARINATRHKAARLLPMSQMSDGATAYWRVLQVSHRLGPDSWTVDIEAVAITGPAT